MQVCLGVILFAIAVALPVGLISGYFGGIVDSVIMRVTGRDVHHPCTRIWPSQSRRCSARASSTRRSRSRSASSRALSGWCEGRRSRSARRPISRRRARSGISQFRMIRRHILPNVAAPLIVQVAISFGYALLAEAGLSFLGLGVQPPNSSWGTMLEDAYQFILSSPWGLFPPGIAIALTVLSFNLVGDGLRDALGREVFVVRREK